VLRQQNGPSRLLVASKVSLSIIDLPSGKDPDELIQAESESYGKLLITQHQYALDWLMKRYQELLDLDSAPGKREFSDILLPCQCAVWRIL
jgi:DNA primase